MVRKIYRKFRKSPITIIVNGRREPVFFNSQSNYITEDKEMQATLEKSTMFNVSFRLLEIETDEVDVEVEEDAEDVEVENNEEEETEEEETEETTLIELQVEKKEPIICNADTSAEAKAFLRERGIIIANSVNAAKVIEVGKANGIEFPNLV